MGLKELPLGRDELLLDEPLDFGFGDKELATALDDGDLPPLNSLVELVAAHAQPFPRLDGSEESGHSSPRNFWMRERVRNRRTLIRPFTRNRPQDIDMPTSLAISPTVSERRRAWAMNLFMSSLSASDAFIFNLGFNITLYALFVKLYALY
jgi:hypothetical protein